MSRLRIFILLFAIVCAVLAAVLVRGIILREPAQNAAPEAARQDNVPVLVAARDMVMGERITAVAVVWRDWPRANLAGSMITRDKRPNAIEELQKGRVRLPMVLGEPIVERKIVMPDGRGFLGASLPKGMRAVSIAVTEQTAASGFILPNDRVDVILTRATDGGNPEQSIVSNIIVSNVRVLAVNQSYGQEEDKVNLTDVKTAVLELEPKQAEALAQADAQGDISLALRSLAEGGDAGLAGERPVLAPGFGKPSGGPAFIRYGFKN